MRSLWIFMLGAVLSFSAYAEPSRSDWNDLNNQMLGYVHQGNAEQALAMAKKAKDVADQLFKNDAPMMSVSLTNLAGAYQMNKDYDKAEYYFKKSTDLLIQTFGGDHPLVLDSLKNLEQLYKVAKRTDDAQHIAHVIARLETAHAAAGKANGAAK